MKSPPLKPPRPDAILKNLSSDEQDAIAAYAERKSQRAVSAWLRRKGLRVSHKAVGRFLAWYDSCQLLSQNAGLTEALLHEIKKADPKITPQRLRQLGQTFFTLLVIRKQDTRGWYMTQQIALRQDKLELDWEKFRQDAAERKARLEAQNAPPKEGGLTDEAIKEITEKLNLM